MKKIRISKSETSNTRSCDFSKVTKLQLTISMEQHISDVRQGILFAIKKLEKIARGYDYTKTNEIA